MQAQLHDRGVQKVHGHHPCMRTKLIIIRRKVLDLVPTDNERLEVGRRIEVRCAPGVRAPWRHPYLCINPTYPLPEAGFFAHLYLYVRDQGEEIIRVAAPQPWDQALGRTF